MEGIGEKINKRGFMLLQTERLLQFSLTHLCACKTVIFQAPGVAGLRPQVRAQDVLLRDRLVVPVRYALMLEHLCERMGESCHGRPRMVEKRNQMCTWLSA